MMALKRRRGAAERLVEKLGIKQVAFAEEMVQEVFASSKKDVRPRVSVDRG